MRRNGDGVYQCKLLSDSEVEICQYSGSGKKPYIPSEWVGTVSKCTNGKQLHYHVKAQVISIGESAFEHAKNLTTAIIPSGIVHQRYEKL